LLLSSGAAGEGGFEQLAHDPQAKDCSSALPGLCSTVCSTGGRSPAPS